MKVKGEEEKDKLVKEEEVIRRGIELLGFNGSKEKVGGILSKG